MFSIIMGSMLRQSLYLKTRFNIGEIRSFICNRSKNIKLEYIVVYKNISEKLDNGHCWIKVKVTVGL